MVKLILEVKIRVHLDKNFLSKKSLFLLKKSLLTYLDKLLKIIRISKKSIFTFFVEAEIVAYEKNQFLTFSVIYKILVSKSFFLKFKTKAPLIFTRKNVDPIMQIVVGKS